MDLWSNMDFAWRIVTCLPLTELWNSEGLLDVRPDQRVGAAEIELLLRDGASFVVADVGKPLRWISAADRFSFWKTEVKGRLIARDADCFSLGDYPDSYCYVATAWSGTAPMPIIVLEIHH
ncbi:hypothetical protein LUI11_05215 [Bradyrhizobium diazoefficiens]|jgi:hypothetical protein|uniref:Uncharacterized protein n=3 Tax=Bradyrhizobium diazoefficiens TaxID=1355477 RepID=A0A810CV12_9BRAD|nr:MULTISPECIES: hypothetical protein [Bradyrhizobium]APO52549.1 hypothetical protein BD122_19805 [Bradyrhizobium diazoefficiens]KOY08509.1 hypothetical protein AF336_18385 [Bradyrhizobium diazoefficiens]MCD9296181.1 hypothetical protein [Bradyrhizobium diazoefficiens]MCD9810779.1 hypothetical protein [Bradyrhizobium diazoefficiens]MCD9828643.1 hypothetical protein [Bradyrhizobium diazoefficiens]